MQSTEPRKARTRLIYLLFAIIGVAIALVVSYPLWDSLILDNDPSDNFPMLSEEQKQSVASFPEEQQAVLLTLSENDPFMLEEQVQAMLEEPTTVDESMPEQEASVLLTGSFNSLDAVHNAEGSVTVYSLADDSRIVRFEGFNVTNGPNLHVLLSPNLPEAIFDSIGESIDLGELKGTVGNQNYEIPDDVNLDDYLSVIIFDESYETVFSVAQVAPIE